MHISVESLEAKHPGEGVERYNAIARIVGAEPDGAAVNRHVGGIDLTGVFATDDENSPYTDNQRSAVRDLVEKKALSAKAEKVDSAKTQDGK